MNNNEELSQHITKGIIDAKNYGNGAGLALAEILVISVGMGFYLSSWWVFGGFLLGFILLMCFRATKIILLLLFTIAWAFIGWIVGTWFDSTGASVILSIITLIISAGLHYQAFHEWSADH